MCDGGVEDGKEGLTLRAVLVVRSVALFVPHCRWRDELVVGLDVVGRVISPCPQVLRKGLHFRRGDYRILSRHFLNFRKDIEGPHVVPAGSGLIHAGDNGTATRGAYPCCCKGLVIAYAFTCQAVDVRRGHRAVAVTVQPRAHVFHRKPQNVGTRLDIALSLDVLCADRCQANGYPEYNGCCHGILLPVTHVQAHELRASTSPMSIRDDTPVLQTR